MSGIRRKDGVSWKRLKTLMKIAYQMNEWTVKRDNTVTKVSYSHERMNCE